MSWPRLVVFRAGFAPTMASARQMVLHRHVGRVNAPSFQVRPGDSIQLHDSPKMKTRAGESQREPNNLKVPDDLEAVSSTSSSSDLHGTHLTTHP